MALKNILPDPKNISSDDDDIDVSQALRAVIIS